MVPVSGRSICFMNLAPFACIILFSLRPRAVDRISPTMLVCNQKDPLITLGVKPLFALGLVHSQNCWVLRQDLLFFAAGLESSISAWSSSGSELLSVVSIYYTFSVIR